MQKSFRYASSVILVSRTGWTAAKFDSFRILMVKRRDNVAENQNTFTFPGGTIDLQVDFDPNWTALRMPALIKKPSFSYSTVNDYLKKLESNSSRLPAYLANRRHQRTMPMPGSTGDVWMPAEHAFKMTAVRALYNNCGLLLAKIGNGKKIYILPAKTTSQKIWNEDRQWVSEDATRFFSLCQKRSLEPAYFLLKEWSNWVSPCFDSASCRVDTVFYTAVLNGNQSFYGGTGVWIDRDELISFEWINPIQLLNSLRDGQVKLSIPHFYEIAQLAKHDCASYLYGMARNRQETGVPQFCPVVARTNNGTLVYLLPGDDEYPNDVDTAQCDVPEARIKDFDINVQPTNNLCRIVMISGDEDFRKTRIYTTDTTGKCSIFDMESVSWHCVDKTGTLKYVKI